MLALYLRAIFATVDLCFPARVLSIDVSMTQRSFSRRHTPPARWPLNPTTLPSPSRHVTYQPSHHLGGPRRSLFRCDAGQASDVVRALSAA